MSAVSSYQRLIRKRSGASVEQGGAAGYNMLNKLTEESRQQCHGQLLVLWQRIIDGRDGGFSVDGGWRHRDKIFGWVRREMEEK